MSSGTEKPEPKQQDDLFIVGIGASAGGIEALKSFFSHCQESSSISYVVIQHLSPDYESYMDHLLANSTSIEIIMAHENMRVEPSKIYLCPPGKYILIKNGILQVFPRAGHKEIPLIDEFLKSLAQDWTDHAVAIIMSGSGSDGKKGVEFIRRYNGLIMVQDETTAEFPSMPHAVISTGMADFICDPADMFATLSSYTRNPYLIQSPDEGLQVVYDERIFKEILGIIKDHTAIDFSRYKTNSILRRIGRRMTALFLVELNDYLLYLKNHDDEPRLLVQDLLIGVTDFFRDPEIFDLVADLVIPKIFEMNDKERKIRIWVPGCSTGQEVYTIAILCHEFMELLQLQYEIKIFGTDIDEISIKVAGRGIFPKQALVDLDPKLVKKYFLPYDDKLQIRDSIRQLVIFSIHDVLVDPPFLNLDMISCRNLLIYLKKEGQFRTISIFKFGLKPGGFLLLGSAETLGNNTSNFSVIDSAAKIFQYKGESKKEILKDLQFDSKDSDRSKRMMLDPYMVETRNLVNRINSQLIEEFAPPAVVIDSNYKIIQVYGDVNDYLKIPHGDLTSNLMDLVTDDLSIAVTTSVRKALQLDQSSTYRSINSQSVADTGKDIRNITAKLIKVGSNHSTQTYVLVIFHKEEINIPVDKTTEDIRSSFETQYRQTIKDLEYEVQSKEEDLQAMVEELETSNEELQSTNEELISSNEELKSTNEELQSVNEELNTMNFEYRAKIEELTQLNTDLDNLIMSTKIGYIFLDEQLKIRKFSENITKVINLKLIDVGRKITDISTNFMTAEFIETIKRVYADMSGVEKIFISKTTQKEHHVIVQPYVIDRNEESGIVITISDLGMHT